MTILEKIQQNPVDTFIVLYWFNLLLDFPLQGEFLAVNKSKNGYVLFVHSAIWGIGITLGLLLFGRLHIWWQTVSLIFGHMLIDAWKCRGWYKKMGISDNAALYIDQALHVGQIILCMTF